jgi:3-dehydroquinate dehydratase-2
VKRILVIHGPNLNLLGGREPHLYGKKTLRDIDEDLVLTGRELAIEVDAFQSNHEGDIVERIHKASRDEYDAIIINPAAFTHTSVALRDALAACGLPFFEVHISNIHSRERFRRKSLVSDIASGIITGFGSLGYRLALLGAQGLLAEGVDNGEDKN